MAVQYTHYHTEVVYNVLGGCVYTIPFILHHFCMAACVELKCVRVCTILSYNVICIGQ